MIKTEKSDLNMDKLVESEQNGDILIDVSIDNYDTTMENDVIIDDLETIRFESVPEKRQDIVPITECSPVSNCSIFGWLFECFT
jgi:hypothetical protein